MADVRKSVEKALQGAEDQGTGDFHRNVGQGGGGGSQIA